MLLLLLKLPLLCAGGIGYGAWSVLLVWPPDMGSYSPLKPGDERNLRGEEDPFVAEQVWEGRRKGDILFF